MKAVFRRQSITVTPTPREREGRQLPEHPRDKGQPHGRSRAEGSDEEAWRPLPAEMVGTHGGAGSYGGGDTTPGGMRGKSGVGLREKKT